MGRERLRWRRDRFLDAKVLVCFGLHQHASMDINVQNPF